MLYNKFYTYTFLINFLSSSSVCHEFPAELSNFNNLSGDGCANCQWRFRGKSLFYLLFSVAMSVVNKATFLLAPAVTLFSVALSRFIVMA